MRGVYAVLCLTVLFGLAIATVEIQSHPYIYSNPASSPTTTVAVVLGASVLRDGSLSPVLRERADAGAALYKAGKVKKILVTGDDSTDAHNEVNPVGKYLLTLGIPKRDIFLDHAGLDTYSSMYRARYVFGIKDMTIVSQPFHLARALYIARHLGLVAYGEEAGNGESFRYNSAREIPATIKAIFDLAFSRIPEFVGQHYPIEGDGSTTWE